MLFVRGIFLFFGLTCQAITLPSNHEHDYQFLLSVFTSVKLKTHDLSLNSFTNILNNYPEFKLQSKKNYPQPHQMETESKSKSDFNTESEDPTAIKDQEEDLYLLCTAAQDSLSIKSKIIALNGINNIHTVYTSKSENLICFISLLDDHMFEEVSQYSEVKSCTIIPPELKIHESLMFFLGLIEEDHVAYTELSRRYIKSNAFEISNMKLVVSGSIGVPHKDILKPQAIQDLHTFKHLLFQSESNLHHHQQQIPSPPTASSHLLTMATLHSSSPSSSLSSEHRNIWSKYAEIMTHHEHQQLSIGKNEISNVDHCFFSKLSLEYTGHSLIVGNLHYIQQSQQSKACYASLLALLVTSKSVTDIRLRFPKYPTNNYIKGIIQKNSHEEDYPYAAVGLDGTGQVIGIGDTGVDEYSCFFRNPDGSKVTRSSPDAPTYNISKRKVIQYINYADGTDTEGGHGTHVSGTVGGSLYGSDTTYQNYNGHASGAKIAFFDMEDSNHPEYGLSYPSITKFFDCAYTAGAKVHSNSWGGSLNAYDSDTLSMDQYLVSNQDFLAIFAAGNDGSQGYYSIGDPAVSKNCLAVGASNSTSIASIAFFSSLGPTFDSRIKPEVVAPGFYTYSAMASGNSEQTCNIIDMAGTSMATPCVSGNAGIIRQYFIEYNSLTNTGCTYTHGTPNLLLTTGTCDSNTNPRGATVKAMLIHSGESMFAYETSGYKTKEPRAILSSPPDLYQGYGRVSLQNILPYPGIEEILKIHVIETSINSLQQFITTIQFDDPSRPFKVTLVYMDPANTIMSTKMLINNLDLIVEDPIGNIYYGNGLAGDDINNVEQVNIPTPTAGTGIWTIRIESDVLPESGDPTITSYSSQPFSLIISAGNLTIIESHYLNMTTYNPLSCSNTQQMITMTLYDNGGDGWGSGNSYLIKDLSDGTVIQTGTMSSNIPNDLMKRSSFCLDIGNYNVSLIQGGGKINEMALEIGQCHLYLTEYQSYGQINISSTTECNKCSHYLLTMTLRGSLYGIPYGWKNSSHYLLKQTKAPSSSSEPLRYIEGTLITSPLLDQTICLTDGTYVVTMNDIPNNDDFLTDDYYSYLQPEVGVEEYRIYFNQNKKLKMKQNQKAIIKVSGTTATISIKKDSHAKKFQLSTGGIIGIILTSIILTIALFVVFFDTTTSIQRIKRLLGVGNNNLDEIPMVPAEG